MNLSTSENKKYKNYLFKINPVFAEMWKSGGIIFSDEYDTAALEIHNGKFRISFNKKYWKKITLTNRLFIICHEYVHLFLGHWLNPTEKNIDSEWMNIAQDIQANEILSDQYFDRKKIKNWKEQCWIDTVFKDSAHLVKKGEDAMYYYNLLMKCLSKTV